MHNLISNGCKVFEIHEKLLHMKAYMVDDVHYSVGKHLLLFRLLFL